ncbi:MAG: hypothetical protein Q4P36_08915 [Bowdeniella nasicola]|nr:hypothetical protein [Bowdeniella nasicola]
MMNTTTYLRPQVRITLAFAALALILTAGALLGGLREGLLLSTSFGALLVVGYLSDLLPIVFAAMAVLDLPYALRSGQSRPRAVRAMGGSLALLIALNLVMVGPWVLGSVEIPGATVERPDLWTAIQEIIAGPIIVYAGVGIVLLLALRFGVGPAVLAAVAMAAASFPVGLAGWDVTSLVPLVTITPNELGRPVPPVLTLLAAGLWWAGLTWAVLTFQPRTRE